MNRLPSLPTPISSRSSSISTSHQTPPMSRSPSLPTTTQGPTPLHPPPPSINNPNGHKDAPLGALVGLFERLRVEKKQDLRKKLLVQWFNHYRSEIGLDLLPVLRLILPQKDRERITYGLKEQNLAKLFIRLIPLGKNDPDAVRLTNWKKPASDTDSRSKTSGDFPTILYEVVSKRSSILEGEGTLNLKRLNIILDDLSEAMGSQSKQFEIMQEIMERATANEIQWICRIILKDLVISVKETTVFAVFHDDAQDLFNTCSDLKKVAWTLYDPSIPLDAEGKTVSLFNAFTPMLCKRPTKTIDHTVKEMLGSEFYIEEKLDGERMQLHKRGDEYFYCSRKGKGYTYLYGKNPRVGSLTPFIASAFDERVESIILDGEMLVWDPASESLLPFGTLKAAALDKSKKEHKPRPVFKVFDLLFLNGQSLLHKSTAFRKKNMRTCLIEIKGRIEFATEWKGRTANDIRMRMDEVMGTRGEGLVIKHPLSKYVLNGRNADWIKVKPEYMDGMGETVDVLVVEGKYGTGARGGGVSSLICAVVDDKRSDAENGTCYSTFVRIGSGLTFSDYAWIRNKPWKVRDPKNPPKWLHTASIKSHDDKGDVYLEPQDSFILKVKAAEIVVSDQYHMGYTMRFPRALAIRDDLDIEDCLTASALLDSLRSGKKRKMETTNLANKKRKTSQARVKKVPQAMTGYRGSQIQVDVSSNIFEGLTFVIQSNPRSRTGEDEKKALLKIIKANGGKQAQIAKGEPKDFIVVYDGPITPIDVKSLMNKGFDIFKPIWVTDSVKLGRKAPFKKKYFFHASLSCNLVDDHEPNDQDANEDANVSETEDEEDEDIPKADSSTVVESKDKSQTADDDVKVKEEEKDALHMDWFKVDEESVTSLVSGKVEAEPDAEEPDPESENEDLADEAELAFDEWDDLKEDLSKLEEASKMGESQEAMEYDQDRIFRHLCFYLDSPANAGSMVVKKKHEQQINESFAKLKDVIIEHGGRIVDLDDPKLTHIVVDSRDTGRRLELIRRTSKPKHRRLVVSQWIEACLDESSLLDEDDFIG